MLDAPTPCPEYTVGDLLDHVGGDAGLHRAPPRSPPPAVGRSRRQATRHAWAKTGERIPRTWRPWRRRGAPGGVERDDPGRAIDLPGEVAGVVALDELVIHGWDVARATGQAYDCDPQSLEVAHGFVAQMAGPGQETTREGRFGPVVPVPDDAPCWIA